MLPVAWIAAEVSNAAEGGVLQNSGNFTATLHGPLNSR
jgi:hypothetical protein